ncbi:LysE/ArgO family amino acid transporter [Ktedonospora formicarum]|uniref:Amino acid transporter n=1 Tax=Ktedonospora formicarum TaxID=2778364 RepID=A0A8J3I9U6_9CHLR|nr:LysE/ArgO family amino acid transporter [Ktedonospora formicarum]GHO49455.1 amino acid transporter [Ktedonospora formicarum]
MSQDFSPLIQGFGLGASLIIAIGAQNAFVLRMGLKRQHVFVIALLSSLGDTILISLGVGGLGTIISALPILSIVASWGGAAFLLVYGFRSFKSALQTEKLDAHATSEETGQLREVILSVLAFSLLNPHAILDTVVLIGSIGAHYPSGERLLFGLGTILASFAWFFALAYGARWLAPLFRSPWSWKILDCFVGCVMWYIAGTLIWNALHL